MESSGFTPYALWVLLPWLLFSPLQYGYAISQLNQIKTAISCSNSRESGPFGYALCIQMTDNQFSLVTSIFLLGGLLGSAFSSRIMEPRGRKSAVQINTALVAVGSLMISTSSTVFALALGRFLIGIGAGIGLCVVPPFLSEIAPPRIRGPVGVLNQLSVVFGILFTQTIGFFLAKPGSWRLVFFLPFLVAVAQFVIGLRMVESPVWLRSKGRDTEAKEVAAKIWLSAGEDVEEALLSETPPTPANDHPPASIAQCFTSVELRRPLLVVSLVMAVQQTSGINAVMYYSTDILSKAVPDAAAYISIGIAVINVLSTFPAIYLLQRYGPRTLLFGSVVGSLVSLVALALALNAQWTVLSSLGVLAFVSFFAVGLGPIPFVIIPHVSPLHAVSSLSSIALSTNWIINFFVGLLFLPMRNWLTDEAGNGAGTIFYLFSVLCGASAFVFFKLF